MQICRISQKKYSDISEQYLAEIPAGFDVPFEVTALRVKNCSEVRQKHKNRMYRGAFKMGNVDTVNMCGTGEVRSLVKKTASHFHRTATTCLSS